MSVLDEPMPAKQLDMGDLGDDIDLPEFVRPGNVVEIISGPHKGTVGYIEQVTEDNIRVRVHRRLSRTIPWRSQLRRRENNFCVLEDPQPGDAAYAFNDRFSGKVLVLAIDGEYADVEFHGEHKRCWIGTTPPVKVLVPAVTSIVMPDGDDQAITGEDSREIGRIVASYFLPARRP